VESIAAKSRGQRHARERKNGRESPKKKKDRRSTKTRGREVQRRKEKRTKRTPTHEERTPVKLKKKTRIINTKRRDTERWRKQWGRRPVTGNVQTCQKNLRREDTNLRDRNGGDGIQTCRGGDGVWGGVLRWPDSGSLL